MGNVRGYALLLLLVLLPGRLFAFSLDVGAGTEFPLATGVESRLQVVGPLHVDVQAGLITGPYVSAVNSWGQSAKVYDSNTAAIIQGALPGAVSLGFSLTLDDLLVKGLLIELGYSLFLEGDGIASAPILTSLLGQDITSLIPTPNIPITGNIQSACLHIGYRFSFSDSWGLVLRVGVVKPFTSTTQLSSSVAIPGVTDSINSALTAKMNDVYAKVIIPTASLAVLYRFGGQPTPVQVEQSPRPAPSGTRAPVLKEPAGPPPIKVKSRS